MLFGAILSILVLSFSIFFYRFTYVRSLPVSPVPQNSLHCRRNKLKFISLFLADQPLLTFSLTPLLTLQHLLALVFIYVSIYYYPICPSISRSVLITCLFTSLMFNPSYCEFIGLCFNIHDSFYFVYPYVYHLIYLILIYYV